MKQGVYIESPALAVLALGGMLVAVLLVGGLVFAASGTPVTGNDIDRIVREVRDAGDGDNTIMVNVQAAAGIGIIQRAESTQAVTKTDTVQHLPQSKPVGLPAWQLILIVAACFLPVIAMGFHFLFDR